MCGMYKNIGLHRCVSSNVLGTRGCSKWVANHTLNFAPPANLPHSFMAVVVLATVFSTIVPSLPQPFEICRVANATETTTTKGITFVLTPETLLSGTALTDCDDPNGSTCVGGMAAIVSICRRQSISFNAHFLILPKVDTSSALPSLHPLGVNVNMDYYNRINSQYPALGNAKFIGFVADPSDLAGGEDGVSFATLKRSPNTPPLSSTLVVPPDSQWRFAVKSAIIMDLVTMESVGLLDAISSLNNVTANPKCAILRVGDAGNTWTTSTAVTPLRFGTRLNGTHLASIESSSSSLYSTARTMAKLVANLRLGVGAVVILGYDTTIPLVTLLEDMLALEIEDEYLAATSTTATIPILNYLPDMYVDTTTTAKQPFLVNISVTYITSNGQIISKTRSVVVAGVGATSSTRVELILNLTAVQAAVGRSASFYDDGSVLPSASIVTSTNSKIVTMNRVVSLSLRTSAYYDDLSYFVNSSRAALANDRIVGTTIEDMPPRINATLGYTTCYAGECARGTLIVRALRAQLDADVSFVSAGIPQGEAWPAGNITQSYLFTIYTRVDTPCKTTMMGLRLWRIVATAFALRSTTSSSGARFLQAAGLRIAYGINQTSGFAKAVSIDVFNRTSGAYEPLERLKYYTVASTTYHCTTWQKQLFSDSYEGEVFNAQYSRQTIPFLMGDYLLLNEASSPYTPLFDNYYTQIDTSDNTTQYMEYDQGYEGCTEFQWYHSGVDTCMDCAEGYRQSFYNISRCDIIPIETSAMTAAPNLVDFTVDNGSNSMLVLVLAVGGGGLVAVIVVIAVVCECWRRSGSRSNHNAPSGSTDVAVIFTDIKTSTKLWGAVPASMGVALDAHHSLIRGAISRYRGYEVKTVGDSFMIVVDDAQRAVDLAVAIQSALYNYEWPTAIDDSYDCNFNEAALDDPDDVCGPEVGAPWNGLRVRIGIHYGPVEVILDEVTKGYDYYGTTVNVAARVEGVADGGQVCASAAVLAAVLPTTSTYTSILLAKTALRGVREEMEVYEIRPSHLPARTFNNPLIFDEEAKANMIGQCMDLEGSSSMSTRATHTSQLVPLSQIAQPIRNIVREAFKAIRGSERVLLLEKLRSAWRVELPSGKAFKGISAAQLAKKEHGNAKPANRHSKKQLPTTTPSTKKAGVLKVNRNLSDVSMYTATTDDDNMTILTSGGGGGGSRSQDADEQETRSEVASMAYSHLSDVAEYDEEDILFHVIAQRVEPSVAALFTQHWGGRHHNHSHQQRRTSSLRMMVSDGGSNNGIEVFSFNNLSSCGAERSVGGEAVQSERSGSRGEDGSFSPPPTTTHHHYQHLFNNNNQSSGSTSLLANLFDVRSLYVGGTTTGSIHNNNNSSISSSFNFVVAPPPPQSPPHSHHSYGGGSTGSISVTGRRGSSIVFMPSSAGGGGVAGTSPTIALGFSNILCSSSSENDRRHLLRADEDHHEEETST